MVNYRRRYSSKKYRHLKKKRSIFRSRFFWYSLAGFLIFLGLFYFFIFSPIFQIRTVVVQGTNFIDASKIKKGIEERSLGRVLLFPTKSIFVLNKKRIRNFILKDFFPAEKVMVKKELFHRVVVTIQEKTPQIVCCSDEECFFADNEGFIFQPIKRSEAPEELPIVRFEHKIAQKDKVVDKQVLAFISSIYAGLRERKIIIQEFRISSSKIEAKMINGPVIYFSPQKSAKLQVENLALVLEDQVFSREEDSSSEKDKIPIEGIKYIDLRFDKIFINDGKE